MKTGLGVGVRWVECLETDSGAEARGGTLDVKQRDETGQKRMDIA